MWTTFTGSWHGNEMGRSRTCDLLIASTITIIPPCHTSCNREHNLLLTGIKMMSYYLRGCFMCFSWISVCNTVMCACVQGLQVGDEVIQFGSVSGANFVNMQSIAVVVEHSRGVRFVAHTIHWFSHLVDTGSNMWRLFHVLCPAEQQSRGNSNYLRAAYTESQVWWSITEVFSIFVSQNCVLTTTDMCKYLGRQVSVQPQIASFKFRSFQSQVSDLRQRIG